MKLLVATDLHDNGATVLAAAQPWIVSCGAIVDLVYVQTFADINPYIHDAVLAEAIQKEWKSIRTREHTLLRELLSSLPETNQGTIHMDRGSPATAILARAAHYDGLVVGTHGRTGLVRAWMGSVAEKLIRHAPIPVLVLPNHL